MKKLTALLTAAALVLSLTACGSQPQAPSSGSTPDPVDSSTPPVSEPETLTPAYSVDGFDTVDADGNRITINRSATAQNGMAVASKFEVSQVGAEILQKGGNAVDAAVAMGFALGVAEPFTSGLGGGGICTIHTADGHH